MTNPSPLHKIHNIYAKSRLQAKKYGVSTPSVLIDYLHSRFRYGFSVEDYFVNSSGYALKNFQKRLFFSNKEYLKLRKRLNDDGYTPILKNKVSTLKYFREYIHHKWCYPSEQTEEEFRQFVTTTPNIIYKPTGDEGGKGIGFCYNTDERLVYRSLKEDKILLEECILQHPDMYFNNKSVNTIRVYTVLDRNLNAKIVKAVLRVGVGDSVVDNYHSGGVIYPVNIDHGFIESYGMRLDDEAEIFVHPGSDIL